ncbi:PAS/PAC sensor hybrid histidine kinase [Cognatiyoonia koreensis]|uniref:Sensor protein FixL n=1 Tax=Cognatiyoonia koreensis TaxID=364200 RepID=A0A1I0QHY9_9RHOB|nr:PAS domain S-box protein [Cognatiyoonia koreensis]SEW26607.1 PAS/PAC sensor hybrid histidine kinase [Cognatiyoonia koreensis]
MDHAAQDGALLRAILEAATDAIIVANEHGIIQQANPAASALFGYSVHEMIGQKVNMLMPDALANVHDGFMSAYLRTGEKQIIGIGREVEGKRNDGNVFPLHLSVGDAISPDGPLFVSIMHDLTQRQATQQALARSQRLDAIGQMTGGIAHDFNNILSVIIGNLELLEMQALTDKQINLLKDALEAAELGADLTSRLLVFARQSKLTPRRTDLRQLCEDTLAILRRTLGSTYRIKTDFAADVAPVMIDPVQLQSALINLALNARDAMGDDGELLISLSNVAIDDAYMAQETDIEAGDYVRLSISDNGAGMTPEAQRRAFEPFFTTKADTGGTGLGLAMVYGFVRQSGGHITLYSELGLGTSFGLYFPAQYHEQARDSYSDPAAVSDVGRLGAGSKVLIVEDNAKVRALSIARLQDLGFETISASSGDEAFAMLTDGAQADILFSDLVMPGTLNGFELAIKAKAVLPELRVLLTSGYASDVVTSAMGHGQEFDILHKPYRQAELVRRLQALLADVSDS